MRGGFWIIAAFVILLRLPFLNQAIQGDDVYYLASAQHAQIDPAHPNHVKLLLLGDWVTMRGHPHPPLNGWVLGGLLTLAGDIREAPFHAAYLLFSLIAAAGMWSLARRFSPRPLEATLLFCVTLPFVVNGASLEADVPFLAFWMTGIALFIHARLPGAALALGLAAMAAFQAVVATPILWFYVWQRRRNWLMGWLVAATPVLVLVAWQIFERVTSETLPAAVLSEYFKTYNLQSLTNKLRNAVALTGHAGWIVFPALTLAAFWSWPAALTGMAAGAILDLHPLFWISFGAGVCLLYSQARAASTPRASASGPGDADLGFLAVWIVGFFAAALVLFFAGSARYLLPISAPVAILVSRRLTSKWLLAGAGAQLAVGLALASVNYQHWGAYRNFVRRLEPEIAKRRVWSNGEWGLRYYLESSGALPLTRGQAVQPGEMVVTSEISDPITFTTGGGTLVPHQSLEIHSTLPLRLIGPDSKSAYSTARLGFRPFGTSSSPIDRVRAELVVERKPNLSYLPMNAPEAEGQIVSGVYQLESGRWRWMGRRASILLKAPPAALPVQAVFFIPEQATARNVTLSVDGAQVAEGRYGTGLHTLISNAPIPVSGETVTVAVSVDKTFSVAGDQRELGMILSEVGFR